MPTASPTTAEAPPPPSPPPSQAADALAFAAAREVCRRHAGSAYLATAFLSRPKRDATCAVYAFGRMIDDAIGERDLPAAASSSGCCSGGLLEDRMRLFRDRLDEIYSGGVELPSPDWRSEAQHVLHALALTVRRYEIPKRHFLDLAEGRRMDLTVARYATWAALENYCSHAAGAAGRVMGCILGLRSSGAGEQAALMGNAMRLTGILRDVKSDRDRGRIYLPLEDMARFRYSERDLAAGRVNDAWRALMQFEIARARTLYRRAAEGICWLADDGSRLTASALAVIHSGILGAIERQRYDVFAKRAALTAGQKVRRLADAWRLARRRDDEALPDVF